MQNSQNIIAAIIIGMSLLGMSFINSQTITTKTISVTGEGRAVVKPTDTKGSISIEVVTKDKEEAYTKMNQTSAKVKEQLLKNGVEENKINTDRLNLDVNYNYSSGEAKEDGFRATQILTFKVGDIDSANKILDTIAKIENVNINGTSFEVTEEEKSKAVNDARNNAVTDARKKADEIANKLGLKIVGVNSVNVSNANAIMPYSNNFVDGLSLSSAEIDLSIADQNVLQAVDVVFEVR